MKTGCSKDDVVKISKKKHEPYIISFHGTEKIYFAYIITDNPNRLNKKEIEGVPFSLADTYEKRLKEETEKLNVWAQEEERKKAVLDWLVTQMHENKLHNLDWLSEMRCKPSEKYWRKVAEISGIEEKIKKHEQYISLDNMFILCALEYSKENSIPAPFEIEEVPLPQTKEIYVIDLKNLRVSFFISASRKSSSSNLSTSP